jgi:hypothetical protein
MQPAACTTGVWPAYLASGWLHPCSLMPRLPWTGLRPNIDGWQEILPQQETRSVADSAKPRHGAKQLLQTWKVL